MIVVVVLLLVVSPVGARSVGATPPAGDTPGGTVVVDSTVPQVAATDTTLAWRVQNDPSACINSNPRPNCGYKPTDAGERGGALQITVFFVMIGAMAVIATVIGRNVVRRDRAIAADLARRESRNDD